MTGRACVRLCLVSYSMLWPQPAPCAGLPAAPLPTYSLLPCVATCAVQWMP